MSDNDYRRWLLHHPISGPVVAKAPADGVYGIPFGEVVWVAPVSQLEKVMERVALLESALDMAADDAERFTVEQYVEMAERKRDILEGSKDG